MLLPNTYNQSPHFVAFADRVCAGLELRESGRLLVLSADPGFWAERLKARFPLLEITSASDSAVIQPTPKPSFESVLIFDFLNRSPDPTAFLETLAGVARFNAPIFIVEPCLRSLQITPPSQEVRNALIQACGPTNELGPSIGPLVPTLLRRAKFIVRSDETIGTVYDRQALHEKESFLNALHSFLRAIHDTPAVNSEMLRLKGNPDTTIVDIWMKVECRAA
jgi:hypothetical protein